MKKPVRKDSRTLRHENTYEHGPSYDGLYYGVHKGVAFYVV